MEPVKNNSVIGAVSQEKILSAKKEELKRACREFESLFTAYILKNMRSTIHRAEAPEHAREIYEAMFDEAVSREISLSGVLGLGDMLYKQLEPLLEAESRAERPKGDTS
ncbi:MAG: rod-binding protein [Syntrophobacterales bacterium]|nr:rod-binding protein [Syntrophobacterales bacterium]